MMKKISIVLTILFAISFAAHAQTVGSANIMGYTKVDTPAAGSYDIVALVQFSDGSNTVHIQDAIANMDQLNSAGTGGWDSADKLYLWNGLNYDQYGLFQLAEEAPYWMESGSKWERAGRESPADTSLSRGLSVWYQSGIGATPTNALTSGDVYSDDTFDVTLPSQFSLLSYPYSSSVNLTNLVISNANSSGTGEWDTADKIYVYNGLNYEQYGLFQPISGDAYWMASGSKWERAGRESPDTLDLNLGSGFWYESPSGAKTIGFTKNYNVN